MALITLSREEGSLSRQVGLALKEKLGYEFIDNYPPYDKLEGAICLAKVITSEG